MSDDHDIEELDADSITRTMRYVYETIDPEHEADLLEALCEGFVRANQIQVRAQPDAYPCCLGCGNYQYVPPQNCHFDHRRGRAVDKSCQEVLGAAPMHRKKKGTCIDLACMLAALYREKENDRACRVGINYQFNGPPSDPNREIIPGRYHAIVVRGDGSIVDPQLELEALAAKQHASQLAVNKPLEVGAACGCSARPTLRDDDARATG